MGIKRKRIPANQLVIDERVQRANFVESTLRDIRENYDPKALNVLQVAERDDGVIVILDGAHRHKVVQEVEGEDYPLNCMVHTGLSLSDMAKLFLKFNKQKPPNDIDKFLVRLADEDDVAAREIYDTVTAYKWTVGKGAGEIGAVKALEQIYASAEKIEDGFGKKHLDDVLYIISNAWAGDTPTKTAAPKAADRLILVAVSDLLRAVDEYETANDAELGFDPDRMVSHLVSQLKTGPSGFLHMARATTAGTSQSTRQFLFRELHKIYNSNGRGGRKLPRGVVDKA